MRGIWTRRNEHVHGKEFRHPTAVSKGAKLEILAFTEAQMPKEIPLQREERSIQAWSKPAIGTFKVNWDAAVRVATGRIGLGVLVRDHQGHVIGALRAARPLCGGPFGAEAYGLLMAAVFCRELGLNHILLEGDSKQVVDQLVGQVSDWSVGGWLVEDARQVLESIGGWGAGHVPREANCAAHALAKSATLLTEDLYNIEECPTCICSIVTSEMLSS